MASGNWVDRDELWSSRHDRKWESFSWLTVRALLSSVNDIIGRGAPRLVNELRGAWVDSRRDADSNGRWDDDLVVRVPGVGSFLLLGDPGEQDYSQYAVVPVLASQDDAGFMVVLSDVIYPSGDVNDYVDGFYIPYRGLRMPIYALPGNHDWYDGLNGFMWNFCGAEPLAASAYDPASYSLRERIARRIWRKASAPRRDILDAYRLERVDGEAWEPLQPGPYYAIELDDLFIVCVDSGITGDIDRAQAEWLVRISESTRKPKLLLVGKPLVDKKRYKPGPFPDVGRVPVDASDGTTFGSVDDVVRHDDFGYVAAIGGDTHNYQRYDVTLSSSSGTSRPFHHVVSGGGGAYMSATHTIDGGNELKTADGKRKAAAPIEIDRFECYPSQRESLRYFAALVVPLLWRLVFRVALALLGVGLAAGAVLVADAGDDTLEAVLAAATATIVLAVLVAYFRPGSRARTTQPSGPRRAVTYAGALLLGLAAGLGAWWLSPEHFGRHMIVVAAVLGATAAIAELLRRTGVWRTTWVSVALLIAQPLAVIAALRLAVLDEADPIHVVVMTGATLLLPTLLLLLVDRLRVLLPSHYKVVLLGGLVALTVAAVSLLDEAWARAVAATVVIVVIGLMSALVAHLHFLGAFSLFYRPSLRDGTLSEEAAQHVLDWRATERSARPADARTRRIGNMVHPGSRHPHGPLHRFISEIFDRDDPPLYKNFLRVDVTDDELTITCFHATGTEAGPADVTWEEPIRIGLRKAVA